MAEFTVLDVTTPDFALRVFPLGHKDIDGLVGMNFLRHFNFGDSPGRAADPLGADRAMNRLTWAEIVQRYPCQWMMLAETEDDDDGNLALARVLDHDQSAIKLLDRTGLVPGATLIHTAGRPLCDTRVSASSSSRNRSLRCVEKFCHGAADPLGSVRTWTDEGTR